MENIISVSCSYATFSDIVDQIQDNSILGLESTDNDKIWIIAAGISVEKGSTLDINSNDVITLKLVPGINTPNAITVSGSLKMDSVKVTSWNLETNDFVYFSEATKYR